jgi:hypothetical protein
MKRRIMWFILAFVVFFRSWSQETAVKLSVIKGPTLNYIHHKVLTTCIWGKTLKIQGRKKSNTQFDNGKIPVQQKKA